MGGISALFHPILHVQRGEKRPDARRASAEIALLFQARATQQVAAYRLAHREPPKRTKAALQPLGIGRAISCGLRLALARLGGSEHAK